MKNKTKTQTASAVLKKTFSLMLSLIMLLSITAGIDLSAYAASGLDYEYEFLDNGTVEFTKYTGDDSSFVIPSKIAGYPVMSIGVKAFNWCTSLTSVIIPNSVISIGESAFEYCDNLTSITIPNSVTNIGDYAFFGCDSLTSITIPNSVISIGDFAFRYCDNLTSITIPNSVKNIGAQAFFGCYSLTSITIPNSVINIGDSAFMDCDSLTSIALSNQLKNISEYMFYGCSSLTSITIPSSVTSIGFCAFEGCHSLTNVTIPNNVTAIDAFAFRYCDNLTSITIPNSVINIGDSAFYWCTSLTSVKIGNNVTNIGDTAFANSALEDIYYNGTINEWNKISIGDKNGEIIYAKIHCSDGVINEVDCINHTWDNGKITKAATCAASGVKTYTCTTCGETKTETIKATGHSYDAGKITKQPTVTTAGVKTYTCTKCKATKTEAIKATGLQTPTLKATVNANGSFKLSWNKVTSATRYGIYMLESNGKYKWIKSTSATSWTTGTAQYGKKYTYKVFAVNDNTSVKSEFSSAVSATNNKKLQTTTAKVTVNANGSFKISWNKVTGATKYGIYMKQANGSYKWIKTVTGTSFTTAVATYGKQYSYKVLVANNNKSAQTFSNVVNAKNTKKLQTPSLKVAVNKNGSFKLSWGKVTGATSYQIYMKQSNGTYKLIKTTSSTSFTTAVASKGKTYSYKVRAVTSKNKNATSNYSKVVSAKRK